MAASGEQYGRQSVFGDAKAQSEQRKRHASVFARRRQSVALVREALFAEKEAQQSSTGSPLLAASYTASPVIKSQPVFSRVLQPYINARFELSGENSGSDEQLLSTKLFASLVACDKHVSQQACPFCLAARSWVREKIVLHRLFDIFILVVIAANAICLAADSPLLDSASSSAQALRVFDLIFTIIFILEAATKIFGLVRNPQCCTHCTNTSYVRRDAVHGMMLSLSRVTHHRRKSTTSQLRQERQATNRDLLLLWSQ
jgi:hypothetical protein